MTHPRSADVPNGAPPSQDERSGQHERASERPTRPADDGNAETLESLRESSRPQPYRASSFPLLSRSALPVTGMLILDTPYVTLSLDSSIVHFTRTRIAYPDVETLTIDLDAMTTTIEKVRIRPRGLLIDMREIAGRNDSAFEETLAPRRRSIVQSFDAVAFVMATHVGRLQAKRHGETDGAQPQVFDDSAAAALWLRQQLFRLRGRA